MDHRRPTSVRLPQPLTTFVGREEETATAVALLRESHVRLLTITGPGGVGKTRLAIEVARHVSDDYVDGVAFVSLISVPDPAQVLETIARTFGIERGTRRSWQEILGDALAERNLLLILDNFEHVIDAATKLSTLLATCPTLDVLVTSRVALRTLPEHVYVAPPLPVPEMRSLTDRDSVAAVPSVALFVRRAQAVQPNFALTLENQLAVAEICQRLDGLPLAIELAAARVSVLQPHGLLARLSQRLATLSDGPRDLPARQRTLADTIAWSCDLLSPEARASFDKLSVFFSGFSLDAASAVLAASDEDTLTVLQELIDSSLIRQELRDDEITRYVMLETLREFGGGRLQGSGSLAETQRRLADWCTERCLQLVLEVTPANVDRFEAELGNLRNSFRWALSNGCLKQSLVLYTTISMYWSVVGIMTGYAGSPLATDARRYWSGEDFVAEATAWSDRIIEQGFGADDLETCVAVGAIPWLATIAGDHQRAGDVIRHLIAIVDQSELSGFVAPDYLYLGLVEAEAGNYQAAEQFLSRSLDLFREGVDRIWTPVAQYCLATVHYFAGDLDRAEPLLDQALQRFRDLGYPQAEAAPLTFLARIARQQGRLLEALEWHREALAQRLQRGDRFAAASNLRGIADVARLSGYAEPAVRFYAAAEQMREDGPAVVSEHAQERYRRSLAETRDALGDDAFERAWAAAQQRTPHELYREVVQFEMSCRRQTDVDQNRTPAERAGLTSREISRCCS